MNYKFSKTVEGIVTDKKVQAAVAKLDKLSATGTLTLEVKYDRESTTYNCKLTGVKQPINTTGKNAGEAVADAVKKVSQILRNDKKTVVDKKEHARNQHAKKVNMAEVEEGVEL